MKQMARPVPYWLFLSVLAAEAALLALCFSLRGTGADGLLHLARYTARLAFLIFLLTFATGALAALSPSDATRWLRRNRRYLGLSFALAHFIHLAALTGFFIAIAEVPDLVTLAGGGLAYVFVLLMALTSNDAALRRLGPKNWRRLHLIGGWYIWLIFMNSYVGRILREAPPEPRWIFVALASLGLGVLVLRVAAWKKRRQNTLLPAQ
jgi:sulfoxide reductase heme-binding subunit YedZ